MQTNIRAGHFTLDDNLREHIEGKLKRIDYAADDIVDPTIPLPLDARHFDGEAHLHFRWGATKNVTAHGHDAVPVADQLLDKLSAVVAKEKDELKSTHTRHGPTAETPG